MTEEIIGMGESALDQHSLALMRELKTNLYQIARRAELQGGNSVVVQTQAEQSLRLIDSFMMSSQAEYGQLQLDLEPLCIGSVMHDAAHELRAASSGVDVVIEAKALKPVMTNRVALQGLLATAGQVMGDLSAKAGSTMVLRSFVSSGGDVGVGVFTRGSDLTAADLRTAIATTGPSHMPLARHSARSGVMLTIADSLARSLGGTLEVKRMGSLRGLATILPRSDQLALV